MKNIKKLKMLLLTTAITIMSSVSVQAATYTVKSGDSLYIISKVFNTNYTNIMKTNNLTNSYIYPGQKLTVPGDVYTVKNGDTLYLIAKRYGISLSNLRIANNKWDSTIYPGQTLILPGISSSNINSQAVSPSVIPYTAEDLDLLARLITAEAENQSYSAKVAVGAAVINRVQSNLFPNSIKGVIYQVINGYYQFTPVKNGFINKPASADAKKAALEALKGSDPSNGAIFYFDDSATNTWLWSRQISARIGNMVFTY